MTYILLAAAVILVLLPPRWDPAIRIKERQMRRCSCRGETHDWDCERVI